MNLVVSPVSIVIDVATGLIALTLLWSGFAKLKSSQLTLKAMRGLGVPEFLQRKWVAGLVPIVELGLGLALLCAPSPVRFIGAVVATALFSVFTFYVTRAVVRGVEVACECFGSSSHEPVDRWTIIRNVSFIAAALASTGIGFEAPSLIVSITPTLLTFFALTVLFVGLVALAVGQHRHINRLRTMINHNADHYRRDSDAPLTGAPIPKAELVDLNGVTTQLSELGHGHAVLLIFSKAGCGDCAKVARSLPDWRLRLRGAVVLIIATSSKPEQLFSDYPEFVGHAYFGSSAARKALGVRMLPTAVLLAADGTSVATEVVEGASAIAELVAAIDEQLALPLSDEG